MTDRGQRGRMYFVVACICVVWCCVTVKLSILHLGRNQGLRLRIEEIRKYEEKILVGRGRVLDRNGNIMAMDLEVKNVCVDPVLVTSNGIAAKVAGHLATVLNMEPAMIAPKLAWSNRYAVIKKYIPVDQADSITEARLKGVWMEDISRRNYPLEELACHVVGFANADGLGISGVESRFNNYLKGVQGLRVSQKDGRKIEDIRRRSVELHPQAGADVFLTLDQNLQYYMEVALDDAMERYHAKGAWAILQRVKTGEILAMANRPNFNLNDYATANSNNTLNACISYCYEPGSTFKMATIAAALDAGAVSPREMFNCENGVWIYGGRPLRDYHPHGVLSVGDVLKVSSNIGAAKVALRLGPKRLREYLDEFGVGHRTGIALAGEEGGLLHALPRWNTLSITRVPMGHEVMVTSLQILGVINAIANDGLLVKPQIVDRIVTADGSSVYERRTEALARPIKPETARVMRKLLTRATEKGGTGTRARFEGWTVAGKTGTSQKVMPGGGYSDSANIASFVGMVPAERPELAMIVVVDEPQPEHTGGVVSAPIFRTIMEQAVQYLGLEHVPESEMYAFGDQVPTS